MSERDADPPLGKGAKAAVILVAAAIVGGAGYMMFQKTPDDVVEEHRAAASAKIEAVRGRMDEARSLAPLTEDTLQAPAERVDIGRQGNGALVHVLRLEEPPPGAEPFLSCFVSVPIHEEIQSHLSGAGLSSSVEDAQALFARFDRVRYLLVVVERGCLAPTVSAATKTYTPGTMRGDAHLFDLQGGRNLGGVRFQATNMSESVRTQVFKGDRSSAHDALDIAVRSDLTMEAYQRLGQSLEPKKVFLSPVPF